MSWCARAKSITMVGVTSKYCSRAIKLLQKHDAGEPVGKCHRSKRQFETRGTAHIIAVAVGSANQKADALRSLIAIFRDRPGEGAAGVCPASFVERDQHFDAAGQFQQARGFVGLTQRSSIRPAFGDLVAVDRCEALPTAGLRQPLDVPFK